MNLQKSLKSFYFTAHCLLLMMFFSTSITAQTGCINLDFNTSTFVADLPKGQYVLHIQSQEIEGTIVTKRFIK